MLGRWGTLIRRLGRPRAALAAVALLALLAAVGWPAGRHLWAAYHLRAARQALDGRDFTAADAHLRACLAVRDDGPTRLLLARCARRAGRYDDAQRHLARCRNEPGATLEAVLLRVQRGRLGDDERYLKRTIAPDHPDAALVLEALALGYAQTDRLASLLECSDLWLRIRPGEAQALYWRGYACERLGKSEPARDSYREAVAADPGHDEARLRLGTLLLERFNQAAEARDQFESLRPRRPDDPAVLVRLARCDRLLGHADEAERLVEAVLERHPQEAAALTERGKLALAAGRTAEAERWLRQAVRLAPDDRDALYNFIRCLEKLGQDDEAREYDRRRVRLEADLARLQALIAEVGRRPDDPAPRREAGEVCLRYGKDEEGLRWLRGALEVAPNDAATLAALADYEKRHDDGGGGKK